MAPTRGGSPQWLLTALCSVVIVVAGLLVAVVAEAAARTDPGRRLRAPDLALTAAADRLALAPGLRVRGTIGAGTPAVQRVDLAVTNEGSLTGTTTRGGHRAAVALLGGATYVLGPAEYWGERRAPAHANYAGRWVRGGPSDLGVDLAGMLAPARLSDQLLTAGRAAPAAPVAPVTRLGAGGPLTPGLRAPPEDHVYTVDGREITLGGGDGSDEPDQVTGIETPEDSAPDPGDVDLRLDELTVPEADDAYRRLQQEIGQLRASVDSAVSFSTVGDLILAPCGPTICVATYTLRNTVVLSSPYLAVRRPVLAAITFEVTVDGRPVRFCYSQLTMPPNGIRTISCTAVYFVPPDRRPKIHTTAVVVFATAEALVDRDIRKLREDLTEAQQDNPGLPGACPLPTGFVPAVATAGGRVVPSLFGDRLRTVTAPAYFPSAPTAPKACSTKGLLKKAGLPTKGKIRFVPERESITGNRLQRGTHNGYLDRFGNEWIRGPGRGRNPDGTASQWEWDVQLTPGNRKRFRWLCARENKSYITHLNVTPEGEISHVVCE